MNALPIHIIHKLHALTLDDIPQYKPGSETATSAVNADSYKPREGHNNFNIADYD